MKYLLTPLFVAVFVTTCQPVVGQIEQPEVPKEVQTEFDRYVGTWELKGKFGDTTLEATNRVRWSMNRRHLLVTVILKEGDNVENVTQLIGWDPVTKEIVSFHFALGGPVIGRQKISEPGVWEGDTEFVIGGKRARSRSKTVFEKDRIVLTTKGEGAPDESYEIRKVLEEPPASGQNEQLKGMGFMIGTWKAEGKFAANDEPDIADKSYVNRENNRWVVDKNAMVIDWEFSVEGKLVGTGKVLRGWNRKAGHTEDIGFGTDGSCGKNTGSRQGDAWVFRGTGIDGKNQAWSGTATAKPVDKQTFTISLSDRVTGGKAYPDLEIVMKREKAEKK